MLPFPATGYSVLTLTFCHECWPCVFLEWKLYCLGCVPVKLLWKVAVGIERRSVEWAFPRLPHVKGLQREHPSWEAGTLTRRKMSSGYSLGSLQEAQASVCQDNDVPLLVAISDNSEETYEAWDQEPGAERWLHLLDTHCVAYLRAIGRFYGKSLMYRWVPFQEHICKSNLFISPPKLARYATDTISYIVLYCHRLVTLSTQIVCPQKSKQKIKKTF